MENFQELLKRKADRISSLILFSDLEWIDIEIEIGQLRQWCEKTAPDKLQLFDLIYLPRFKRLWLQWRETPPE